MDTTPPPSPRPDVSSLRARFENMHQKRDNVAVNGSGNGNGNGAGDESEASKHKHRHFFGRHKREESSESSTSNSSNDKEAADDRIDEPERLHSSGSRFGSFHRRPAPPPPEKRDGVPVDPSSKSDDSPKLKIDPTQRPVPIPNLLAKAQEDKPPSSPTMHPLSRKPPPPPPSRYTSDLPLSDSTKRVDISPTPSVSSLRDKLNNTSIRAPSPQPSVAKKSTPPLPPRQSKPEPRVNTQAIQPPMMQLESPSPTSASSEENSGTPARAPPRLPTRNSREIASITTNGTAIHGRDRSLESLHSPSSMTSPPPPPHPNRSPPMPSSARPPTRQPTAPPVLETSLSNGSRLAPPSHPSRQASPSTSTESTSSISPRLPVRRPSAGELRRGSPVIPPSASDTRLPPPPTRSIGPNEKLPPVRPILDEDSTEEDALEEEARQLEAVPDEVHSSRRPPLPPTNHNAALANISVPNHSQLMISGDHVIVAHHHCRVFSIANPNQPLFDKKVEHMSDWHKKTESKVTAMEFRRCTRKEDLGSILWLGTKDGHIFEMDIRTGRMLERRHTAHTHPITHIWRSGRSMITYDELGKILIFTADDKTGDVSLESTVARTVRITDKQDWIASMGKHVFTASRNDMISISGSTSGAVLKAPQIKVYDVMADAAVCIPQVLVPREAVGAVTSHCILPGLSTTFYLGHEGGYVSVWDWRKADEVGRPGSQVVKVSLSDVMCMAAVHDRIWIGSRNGQVTAFDPSTKPWTITNRWMAHPDIPVMSMRVDPFGIDKIGQLLVSTIGKDEKVKVWDGLFGLDWVDQELMKHEPCYSTFRDLKVLIFSWNVDAQKPDQLTGRPENVNVLNDAFTSLDSPPDIVIIGLQECVDLESGKVNSKALYLQMSKNKDNKKDDGLSDKLTRSYRMWHDRVALALRVSMPSDVSYSTLQSKNMIGLFTTIFIKNQVRDRLRDMDVDLVMRGVRNEYGNKGAILTRFVIDDTSFCYANCHLAAGHGHTRQRNADVANILEEKQHFDSMVGEDNAYGGGGDGTMVKDHELIFLGGDLNYRIEQSYDNVTKAAKDGNFDYLRAHDQLLKQMKLNPGFRMRTFNEAPLTFPPTYKYDRRSDRYDTSEKHRVPAWCDRILWQSRDDTRVEPLHYRRYEADMSDHRPISAGFRITVKSVNPLERASVKVKVEHLWRGEKAERLAATRAGYVEQGNLSA